MYLDILRDAHFFLFLFRIDKALAEQSRKEGCLHCGGPLHYAPYSRVGHGGPGGLPEECRWRLSLCCGRRGCRRRVLPPSCLYLGRRWSWAPVVVVAMVLLQQRREGWNVDRLAATVGFKVSRTTLVRWLQWFREAFPTSAWWQRLRGLVPATVSNAGLPGSLVLHFEEKAGDARKGLAACLQFLASGWQPEASGHAG